MNKNIKKNKNRNSFSFNFNKLKKQAGFAIIEALISTLLFIVGFIGVIQLTGLMTLETNNAKYRSEAVELSNEMTSYIMFDRANVGTYTDASPNTKREAWDNAIEAKLPQGSSSVSYNATTSELTIQIKWQAQNDPDERMYEVVTFLGS